MPSWYLWEDQRVIWIERTLLLDRIDAQVYVVAKDEGFNFNQDKSFDVRNDGDNPWITSSEIEKMIIIALSKLC